MNVEFLHGLDEAIQEQAMQDFWRTWRYFIIGGVVVLFIGVAGWQYYTQSRHAAVMQEAQTFYKAMSHNPTDKAALEKLAAAGSHSGYQALAQFKVAALEPKKAEAMYTALANNSHLSTPWRDLARLMLAQTAKGPEAHKMLEQMVTEGSPYKANALELLAIQAQNNKQYAQADGYYQRMLQLKLNPEMQQRVRQRLSYMAAQGLIPKAKEEANKEVK